MVGRVQHTLSFFLRRLFAGTQWIVSSTTGSSWLSRVGSGKPLWVGSLISKMGRVFMVMLSTLPRVVTRVFNNLAYSVSTFGVGPSSSESGMLTVRILIPFRLLTLTPRVESLCRLAMEKELERERERERDVDRTQDTPSTRGKRAVI